MDAQASYRFVRDYYLTTQRKKRLFPETTGFWRSYLTYVDGRRVLNLGCGPQFFDYARHFGTPPEEYVGIDINRNTFTFLARSRIPNLLAAKRYVRESGTHTRLICEDAFKCGDLFEGQFDCVLGVGFFGIFRDDELFCLTRLAQQALIPGGTLLKITWHGRNRPPGETSEKRTCRFEPAVDPSPDELVSGIERGGLFLRRNVLHRCEPGYGWKRIQVCVFRS